MAQENRLRVLVRHFDAKARRRRRHVSMASGGTMRAMLIDLESPEHEVISEEPDGDEGS